MPIPTLHSDRASTDNYRKRPGQKTFSENNRISYHNSPKVNHKPATLPPRCSLRTNKKDSDKTGQNIPISSLQGGVGTIYTVIFRPQTSFQTLPPIPYFPESYDCAFQLIVPLPSREDTQATVRHGPYVRKSPSRAQLGHSGKHQGSKHTKIEQTFARLFS